MHRMHVVPGTREVANGMVAVARMLATESGDAVVVDLGEVTRRDVEAADEVWVHGMWLPREWKVCRWTIAAGKRFVRMVHGSLSPVYLKHQGKWKKRLVGPIERWLLRKATRIVATCDAEKEWIEAYLGRCCPPIEVTDMKRFFDFSRVKGERGLEFGGGEKLERELHILYLGRKHPLKGVWQLEKAVEGIGGVELRIVSNASGEEKEKAWDWCDVLVLPSLSENFGLVIAEALERGKRVVATDGAPAWSSYASATEDGGGGNDYGGRLIYLNGYRDGSDEKRVELLKKAIERICT